MLAEKAFFITDTAPDIMAIMVNADRVHISWRPVLILSAADI